MIVAVAALRTELAFVRGMPRVRTGIGHRARERLTQALERLDPEGVVVLGFCGATHARLVPGRLVLADVVLGNGEEIELLAELVERARERLPDAEVGPIATVEGIADPAEKARRSVDAVAVDMESYHIARELRSREIPFVVVRCVLDVLWEDISRGNRVRMAGRALSCARRLGRAAAALAPAVGGER